MPFSETATPPAFEYIEGAAPAVMFLCGFKSDMQGTKAMALRNYCAKRGQAFLRFDYRGHGQDASRFEDYVLSDWLADSVWMLDNHTHGPAVLVGSSMGGWLALRLAQLRPQHVAGVIGIAAAPDFTQRLMWDQFSQDQQETLVREGRVLIPDCYGAGHYAITRALIDDGQNHLLLDAPLAITAPIHLLHGTADADVPLNIAHQIVACAPHTKLHIIEGGNHRLSEPQHLALLYSVVEDVLHHNARSTSSPSRI